MKRIVIDIYGADAGIEPVVKGAAKALKAGYDFFPIFVGDEASVISIMESEGIDSTLYETMHTDKFITNNDPPTVVFAGNDDASLVMAFDRLKKDDSCDALISAGSTGAMLVASICRLGLVGKMKYPALCSALPCGREDALLCLVDCGANVDCTAADLVRFAKLGDVFCKVRCGLESPRVGLMSVGREAGKGNALTKEAYELISQLPINFVGNLEGSDMVSRYADVIVTDGFSGNILLKNTEAVGLMAAEIVKRIAAGSDSELVDRITSALYKTFDFNSQGAATFLGPKKTVVKMHGSANEDTTVSTIEQVLILENSGFSSEIARVMQG